MPVTVNIGFTPEELVILETTIGMGAPRDVLAVPPITNSDLHRMALKVGRALITEIPAQPEGSDEPPTVVLRVNEKEAWYWRETVNILLHYGKTPVGMTIKNKLYQAIHVFAQAEAMKEIGAAEENAYEEAKYETRKRYARRAHKKPNTNAGKDAADDTGNEASAPV